MKHIIKLIFLFNIIFSQVMVEDLTNYGWGVPDKTYLQLIHIPEGFQDTLNQVFDGDGTGSVLWLSTDSLYVKGVLIADTYPALNDTLTVYVLRTELADSLSYYYNKVEINDTLTVYYTKAEVNDTLAFYYTQTLIDNALALKQAYSDTNSFDATKTYVLTTIDSSYIDALNFVPDAEMTAHKDDANIHHVPTVDTNLDSAGIDAFGFVPDLEFQDSTGVHRTLIDANTGKDTTGIFHSNRASLDLVSGTNTGDQDLSGYTQDSDTTSWLGTKTDLLAYLLSTDFADSLAAHVSDIAYDATSWNGNLDPATKNAIRDKIESLGGGHDPVTLNANAIAGGLSLSTQEINFRAATNAQTGYATAAHIQAIEANTGKDTTGIYHANRTALDNVSGSNTGDEDLSGYTEDSDSLSWNATKTDLLDYLLLASVGDSITTRIDSTYIDVLNFVADLEFQDSLGVHRTALDLNTTHRGSDGSDHSFIDQSVISGATPTFTGTNITGIPLNNLANPTGNSAINMTTRQLKYTWTAPVTADGALELNVTGAFSGDLLHIHQHTGNPGSTNLVKLEAEDADVIPLTISGAHSTTDIILSNGVGINEFSNDGTMTGNSANAVPTEQAVKAYVDGQNHQWITTGSDIYYNTGNVGIGTESPDGKLHVHTATAGAVTASANANDLVVENSDDGGISILTPDGDVGAIYFGSPTDNIGASITHDYTAGELKIGTSKVGGVTYLRSGNAVAAITLDANQNVGIGTASPDGKLDVKSGSAGAIVPNASFNEVVIESASDGGIGIYTPDANSGGIIWGSDTDDLGAQILWSNNGNFMEIKTRQAGDGILLKTDDNVTVLTLSSAQLATFAGIVAIGTGATGNSTDPMIEIRRDIGGAGTNPHSFSDASDVNRSGDVGFNSYNAVPDYEGTYDYDHYTGFQTGVTYGSSGTIDDLYGHFFNPDIAAGTATNVYGEYIANYGGTGTITNAYGVYVEALTNGATLNYPIYVAGGESYFGGNIKVNGANYVTEGHDTGRNIMRSMQFTVQPGATPNTNINVTARASTYNWNPATVTNATNLAKTGSSGSWALDAGGTTLTFNITEVIIGILDCNITLYGKINTASGTQYLVGANISSGNVDIFVTAWGTTTLLDWTTIIDAADLVDIRLSYVTST